MAFVRHSQPDDATAIRRLDTASRHQITRGVGSCSTADGGGRFYGDFFTFAHVFYMVGVVCRPDTFQRMSHRTSSRPVYPTLLPEPDAFTLQEEGAQPSGPAPSFDGPTIRPDGGPALTSDSPTLCNARPLPATHSQLLHARLSSSPSGPAFPTLLIHRYRPTSAPSPFNRGRVSTSRGETPTAVLRPQRPDGQPLLARYFCPQPDTLQLTSMPGTLRSSIRGRTTRRQKGATRSALRRQHRRMWQRKRQRSSRQHRRGEPTVNFNKIIAD